MGERFLCTGNDAVGWGALSAGCEAFYGYPITPQNEIIEWFSREFPKRGKAFLQTPSETSSINMVYGAATTGLRVITSTAGPGWGLMQEGISNAANAELPFVISLVQRGGPGQGTTRHAQMDYLSATRGGGQGGYKTICLAPASVQENHDLVQLAFYLADKYRNPVIMLTESIINQTAEPLEVKTIDFGTLPDKEWCLKGRGYQKDKKRRILSGGQASITEIPFDYVGTLKKYDSKHKEMIASEIRYEEIQADDADLLLVAFGYTSRVSMEVIDLAREQGLKVGLIRPIALWPFPYEVIKQHTARGAKFLVVEDNLGQMIDDVRLAVEGNTEVHFVGALSRHAIGERGMIFPSTVFEEVRRILG